MYDLYFPSSVVASQEMCRLEDSVLKTHLHALTLDLRVL